MRTWEAICGVLAIIIATTMASLTYHFGFIAPDSVQRDLIGIAIVLGVFAAGLLLDLFAPSLVSNILLGLGMLALAGVALAGFDIYLVVAAYLAFGATVLAIVRLSDSSARTHPAR